MSFEGAGSNNNKKTSFFFCLCDWGRGQDCSPSPVHSTILLVSMSGWLSCHFSSRRHLSSACAFASHCAPLTPLVRRLVVSPLVTPTPPTVACASASHWATASHHAPLAPLFSWLIVASLLVTPPSPVYLLSASPCTTASQVWCMPMWAKNS